MAGPFVQISTSANSKSIALQDLPESAWRSIVGSPLDESLSPAEVFTKVPWIYRACVLRAHTLANIPCAVLRGTTEVWSSEDAEQKPPKQLAWLEDLYDLLYRSEMALCLDARAYWLRKRNTVRTLGFQWLLPSSVTPQYDRDKGLIGFERRLGSRAIPLNVDDVAYWWLPSITAELGPGVSPVRAALNAAGLLKGIDDFGRGFFDRGAINTTILSVEGNASPEELARLERWWKRLVSGVKRAFETVAVRANIKPIVVGSPPKDMALETLTAAKRLDISVAIGVPLSLLQDQASNYATARESTWSFLNFTVLPEAEMLERGLNKQVFGPQGYEFRFKPEKLEVMLERRAQDAYKMLPAVIAGLITGNEFRGSLGLEAIPELDDLRELPAQLTPNATGVSFPELSVAKPGSAPAQEQTDSNIGEGANMAADRKPAKKSAPKRTVKRVQRDENGRITAVIEDTAD